MSSPDEDVSVRTLLKAVMRTEPNQTPVRATRRESKLESSHAKRRSARLLRHDIGLMSPSIALRSKQKQKILQSVIKSPHPVRTKSTLKVNKPLICPRVLGNQEEQDEFTPRGLLRRIILTQPDNSLVIPNRPVRDDDHEQASSPGASRPSTETFNVDLPDLSTGNITAFVKGISRKRPKKKISATVFERDLEVTPLQVAENQQQEPTENISALSAGTASFSSFNLSLKTPVEEDPKNHGLRRRAPKRKAINIEDFEEGVQNYLHKKMAGLEKSCVDPQKVLCETPGMEKFTLGLSAALPPDLTEIAFNNTELFEPPFYKSPNLPGQNTPAMHTASLHSIKGADSIEEEEEEEEEEEGVRRPSEVGMELDREVEEEDEQGVRQPSEVRMEREEEEEGEGVRQPSEIGMEREVEEEEVGEGVRQPSEIGMEMVEEEGDEKVDVADGDEDEEGEEKVDDMHKDENQTEEQEEEEQEEVIDDSEDEEVAEEREVGEEEERESVLDEPENMETEHTERRATRSQIEVKEMGVDSMYGGKEYSGSFTGDGGDLGKEFESPAASSEIDRQPESAVHIFQHAEQRRASQAGGPTYSVNDPTNTISLNQTPFTPGVEPSTPFAAEAYERGRANAPGTPRESERLSSPPSGGASAQETPQTSAGGALGAEEEEEEEEEEDDEEALASDGAESIELSLKTPAFLRTKKSVETPASSLSTPHFLKGKAASKSLLSAEKAKKPQQKKNKVGKADKVPGLPKSLVNSVFSHFAKTTVSRDTYPILQQCLDKYFDRLSDDLEAYASHAKRKTIELADVELLLKRQGFVSDKMPLKVLIERHLPMEYRKLLIPVATSGNRVIPKM